MFWDKWIYLELLSYHESMPCRLHTMLAYAQRSVSLYNKIHTLVGVEASHLGTLIEKENGMEPAWR